MNTSARKALAAQIAAKTEDAYSAARYADWALVADRLLAAGYNERETEAIMRSKWMRWAADEHTADYGKVPAKAIIDFIKKYEAGECCPRSIDQLVKETF